MEGAFGMSEPNQNRQEVQTDRETDATRAKKLSRRIRWIVAGLVLFAVIAVPLIRCLDNSEDVEAPPVPTESPDVFFEPDYEYDILQDPAYLELDRSVHHTEGGVEVVMDATNRQALGKCAMMLEEMVGYIVAGDVEQYNALLTQKYIEAKGEQELFAMQQLYNIHLEAGETEQKTEDGKTVAYQIYYVSYCIRQNNGTFRRDIGSDESRTQIILLTDREGGEIKIDSISYIGYQ